MKPAKNAQLLDHVTLMYDAKLLWPDLLRGIAYVLAAFYLSTGNPRSDNNNVLMPFVAAAFAMLYLTWFLLRDERAQGSAALYFNLPQPRAARWWAHCLVLTVSLIVLEGVALAGCALRLNASPGGAAFLVRPQYVALPFLAMALALWYAYRRPPRWLSVLMVIFGYLGIFAFAFASTRNWEVGKAHGIWSHADALVAAVVAIVSVGLWFHAGRYWLRLQIGEVL